LQDVTAVSQNKGVCIYLYV